MPLKAHPLGNLMGAEEIQLGRLVRNAREPNQEFHDPFSNRPRPSDIAVNTIRNWQAVHAKRKSTKLGSYLSDAVSAFGQKRSTAVTRLDAVSATTNELKNSGTWFKEACTDADTRLWIEDTIDENENVYLIVGTLVVRGATLSKTSEARTTTGLGVEAAVNPVNNNSMSLAVGVQVTNETSYGHMTVFEAPGDNVVAVRYRKVKHRFYRSSVDHVSLEGGSRWKSDFEWRGEDENEEDTLEVTLDGAEDLGIEEWVADEELGAVKAEEHEDGVSPVGV